FGAFKPALIDLAVGNLAPITSEMRRLMDDPGNIDAILADGSERARAIAAPVLEDVKAIVGFVGARG
ncbi:MAG: tryptophan--tRNA ligase, partial [Pseudomonadota bacterium]